MVQKSKLTKGYLQKESLLKGYFMPLQQMTSYLHSLRWSMEMPANLYSSVQMLSSLCYASWR